MVWETETVIGRDVESFLCSESSSVIALMETSQDKVSFLLYQIDVRAL